VNDESFTHLQVRERVEVSKMKHEFSFQKSAPEHKNLCTRSRRFLSSFARTRNKMKTKARGRCTLCGGKGYVDLEYTGLVYCGECGSEEDFKLVSLQKKRIQHKKYGG